MQSRASANRPTHQVQLHLQMLSRSGQANSINIRQSRCTLQYPKGASAAPRELCRQRVAAVHCRAGGRDVGGAAHVRRRPSHAEGEQLGRSNPVGGWQVCLCEAAGAGATAKLRQFLACSLHAPGHGPIGMLGSIAPARVHHKLHFCCSSMMRCAMFWRNCLQMFMLRATQLLPHTRHTSLEKTAHAVLTGHARHTATFKVLLYAPGIPELMSATCMHCPCVFAMSTCFEHARSSG
jgi:hypothetical protein